MTFRSLSCIFPCKNITETAAWYEEKLGFTKKEFLNVREPHICLYKDGTEIILLSTKETVRPNRELYGYGFDTYIYTAEMDDLYQEYLAKGVKIVRPPELSDYNNREFVIEDPEGRHIAVGLKQERKIRKVKADDPDFIELCTLLEQAHRDVVREQRHPEGDCLKGLERFSDIFILYIGEKAAGSAALGRLDEHTGEVCRVYVKEKYRNNNVAKDLMNKVEETARQYGMKRLILDTYDRFEAAVNLYRGLGYTDMDYTDPKSPYSKYMEKKLD